MDARLKSAIIDESASLGIDPVDLATVMAYETGGTFDPWQRGPTTKWGVHRGLIQWGEPQRKAYGVSKDTPVEDQVKAAGRYLRDAGVKPGMGLIDLYSAVNAGRVGRPNASDRPGKTVRSHVAAMEKQYRDQIAKELGGGAGPSIPQDAVLARGRNNDATRVRALQKSLLEAGFDPGIVDGDYGPQTEDAVLAAQRAMGIRDDGKWGRQSNAAALSTGLVAPVLTRGQEAAGQRYTGLAQSLGAAPKASVFDAQPAPVPPKPIPISLSPDRPRSTFGLPPSEFGMDRLFASAAVGDKPGMARFGAETEAKVKQTGLGGLVGLGRVNDYISSLPKTAPGFSSFAAATAKADPDTVEAINPRIRPAVEAAVAKAPPDKTGYYPMFNTEMGAGRANANVEIPAPPKPVNPYSLYRPNTGTTGDRPLPIQPLPPPRNTALGGLNTRPPVTTRTAVSAPRPAAAQTSRPQQSAAQAPSLQSFGFNNPVVSTTIPHNSPSGASNGAIYQTAGGDTILQYTMNGKTITTVTDQSGNSYYGGSVPAGGASSASSSGSTVLCTYFMRKGWLAKDLWKADARFSRQTFSAVTIAGYHAWAVPAVRAMQDGNRFLEIMLWPVVKAWATEIGFRMGVRPRGSVFGKIIRLVLEPMSWAIGLVVTPPDWRVTRDAASADR